MGRQVEISPRKRSLGLTRQQRYEDAAVAAWEGLQKHPENEELQSLLRKCVKKGRTDYHQK